MSIAIYHRALSFGLIDAWDDSLYFLRRPAVQHWFEASWSARLLTPELGYPVPLPTFLYFLCRQLPAAAIVPAAHALNLGFHLAAVALAYLLARRWLGRGPGLLAAGLWAAHPLLVESVAWITDLKVVALATFVLAGALAFDRVADPDAVGARWHRWAALGCVLGGLMCRPEAVVVPVLYAVILAWRRGPGALRSAEQAWPIWAGAGLALAYVPLAVSGQGQVLAATAPDLSVGARLVRMGAALTIELAHVVRPFDLQPAYYADYAGVVRDAWIGLGLALGLAALWVWAWRKRHPALMGLSIFWLFYAPASGIAVLPRFTADTYMYLPLFGLLLAAVAAVGSLLAQRGRDSATRALVIVAVVCAAALSLLSIVQSLRWQNGVTLWAPVLEASPDHAQPYWIVGQSYARAGEHDKALEVFLAGEPVFYDRQRVPLSFAEELLRAGRPEHAARVAAVILTYDGLEDPAAGTFFAWVVAKYDVNLAGDARMSEAYRRAAERVVEARPDWPPQVLERFAGRLEERGLSEWSSRIDALRARSGDGR